MENCVLEFPKASLFGAGAQNAFIWHPLQQPFGALRARAQLRAQLRLGCYGSEKSRGEPTVGVGLAAIFD